MSTTQNQIGISSIGIQSIMPTTGTPRRATKRKPDDDHDTDDAPTKSNHASPSPHPLGIGSLVDKVV
jgi:hypothetical protein